MKALSRKGHIKGTQERFINIYYRHGTYLIRDSYMTVLPCRAYIVYLL